MPHFQFSFITKGIEYVWAVAERELELNTIPKLRRWQGRPSYGQGCLADSAPLTDWPLCIPGACRGSTVWAERSRYDCNALLVTGPGRGTWIGTCAMLWLAGMWTAFGNFWLLGVTSLQVKISSLVILWSFHLCHQILILFGEGLCL